MKNNGSSFLTLYFFKKTYNKYTNSQLDCFSIQLYRPETLKNKFLWRSTIGNQIDKSHFKLSLIYKD